MKTNKACRRRPLAALIAGLFIGGHTNHAAAQAQPAPAAPDEQVQRLPPVEVRDRRLDAVTERTGSYTTGSTATATRFDLSPRETPQATSVVTRQQMDDFGLTDVNRALEATTGITVERVETDRTYYTARGFDITMFQVDGVGVPFTYLNTYGNLDTAFYDRIEVVRGASGLMAGLGNPSATINFVRKRPKRALQASAELTAGTWNNRRVEVDVTGALTAAGGVRGRAVAAYQDAESYLDRYAHEKKIFYGVLETDISPRTLLTVGHSRQNNRADSPLWGALPLYNTDGAPTTYDVSVSTAADWALWKTAFASSFVELAQAFANGWHAKALVTRNRSTSDSKLFYVYGTPDPTTPGSDLFSFPSLYDSVTRQTIADVYATGPFALFGRRHELVFGAGWSKVTNQDISHFGEDIGTEIPHLETWDGRYPQPAFTGGTDGGDTTDKQYNVYAAVRASLTDRLKAIAGARLTDLDSSGTTYGRKRDRSYDDKVTPYAGVVYDLHPRYSAYASYTKLFQPQFEVDVRGDRLEPVVGRSTEAGVKYESADRKLNAGLAVFRTRQRNLAEPAGFVPFAHHTASAEIKSSGYELDIAGEVLRGVQLAAGYTYVKIEDVAGAHTRTFVPRQTLRLSTTWRVLPAVRVGMHVRWQDDTHVDHEARATTGPRAGSPIRTEQASYALLDLMARYELAKNVALAINLNNVTDEKYHQSLYWAEFGQAYYGAPRHVNATLSWKF